ncbi:MAG: GNAT family N-acetyltransferase [Pseudomonadota bacterium]
MPPAPVLQTARLRGCPPQASDVDDLTGFYADPAHFDSLGGRSPEAGEAAMRATIFVAEAAQFWAGRGYGPFLLRTKTRFVGLCGFRPPPDETPADVAWPFLIFGVERELRRRGYASEAARAAMVWMQTAHRFTRIDAATREDNAAAQSVLRKLGFAGPTPTTLYGAELSLFRWSHGA